MPVSVSATAPSRDAPAAPDAQMFHSLPIRTDFEGVTDVCENFTAAMTRGPNDGLWRATFRGRALLGEDVHLPEGYAISLTTIATKESLCPASSASSSPFPSARPTAEADELETSTQVSVEACAPRYMVWEHDKAPTTAAAISQWITLAQLIHTPSE
ncbi:hypothetical protein LSCM1_07907 [Leishmania martiniquensis]|uniref:Uncharacterized protein n=1 Tax=Leishmania martiniquensis TaxID=1580590 RepID=A0A836H083_9TRYP|nr:hypothetical protein LSCM1_07907 [Leishmania martiniquensis]